MILSRLSAAVILSLPLANATAIQVTELPSTAKSNTVWPTQEVPVCWENGGPSFSAEMAWVRDAVTNSWQQHGNISFTGWGACLASAQSGQGIRISIQDVNPHVKALGRELDGLSKGMVLNFTFDAWSTSCRFAREQCIRSIAVHEFGHAIGFSHEQNRPDSPEWCRADAQGADGDWKITPFDLDSVMNYCNPKWNGDGKLSQKDIEGVKALYPRLSAAQIDPTKFYRLITRVTAQCIHVQNANSAARNAMWQWTCLKQPEFKFKFETVANGFYRIRSVYDQCFHVQDGPNNIRRKALWQWPCKDSPEFNFALEQTEDGWVRIKSQAGMCFHVRNGPTYTLREPLWSWECVNQPEFYFRLQPADF